MSRTPIVAPPRGLGLLLLSVTTAVAAGSLGAQVPQPRGQEQQARLQGVVVLESTFEPIADAVVSVIGTDFETRTGLMGDFAIPDVPDGVIWVRVTVPGMPSVREQVEVGGTGILFLQFRMPDDVSALLDDVFIDVVPRTTETTQVATALDLVAQKVPSINMRASGTVGNNDGAVRLRGFTSLTQNGDPIIVIDDVVARGAPPLEILSQIPAGDVASIEVLRGPAAAFRYPWAANGVIRVRTKKN